MNAVIAAAATYLIFVIALGVAVVWLGAPREHKVAFALEGALAAAIMGVLVKVTGLLWTDPRPFVVDHVAPLVAHGADNGFPSDHTALAMAAASVVWVRHRVAGSILIALTVCLGAARVAARVHHVPDILAGLAVGVIAAVAAIAISDPLLRRLSSRGSARHTTASN